MIYFIQDTGTCHIKIGFTDGEADDRLKALQTGNPAGLVLLCVLPGDKTHEAALHQRFATGRERGEWFRPTPDLLLFLIEEAGIVAFRQGQSSGRTWPYPLEFDSRGVVRCPVCGFNCNRLERVGHKPRPGPDDEIEEAFIHLRGECGHSWVIVLRFHEGEIGLGACGTGDDAPESLRRNRPEV